MMMFVINKIFIKIWYIFRKYHRKKFINYFKENGLYDYIKDSHKKGIEPHESKKLNIFFLNSSIENSSFFISILYFIYNNKTAAHAPAEVPSVIKLCFIIPPDIKYFKAPI